MMMIFVVLCLIAYHTYLGVVIYVEVRKTGGKFLRPKTLPDRIRAGQVI
jgi:hypothetical protein